MTQHKKTEEHSSETSARIAQKQGICAQARDSNHPQPAGPRRDRTSRTLLQTLVINTPGETANIQLELVDGALGGHGPGRRIHHHLAPVRPYLY